MIAIAIGITIITMSVSVTIIVFITILEKVNQKFHGINQIFLLKILRVASAESQIKY